MRGWIFLVISEDLPLIMEYFPTWNAARDRANEFSEIHNLDVKFFEPPDDDEEQTLHCDTAAFCGSIGVYRIPFLEDKT